MNKNLEDLNGEIWKNIEGYDGDYQISNFGRIKSLKFNKEKILLLCKNDKGYLYVKLCKNNKKKNKRIHILMFENFIGLIPDGYIVHHIDENKMNNFLDNFKLMTLKYHTSLHKIGKKCPKQSKRMTGKNNPNYKKNFSGENHPRSILKEQDIPKIRKYLDEGILTQKEIARMFGVGITTISDIKLGKRWKYNKGGK